MPSIVDCKRPGGSNHRIRAVATVSAEDIARQFRLGADGTQDPAAFQSMLEARAGRSCPIQQSVSRAQAARTRSDNP
jgi:hypothetical protein